MEGVEMRHSMFYDNNGPGISITHLGLMGVSKFMYLLSNTMLLKTKMPPKLPVTVNRRGWVFAS